MAAISAYAVEKKRTAYQNDREKISYAMPPAWQVVYIFEIIKESKFRFLNFLKKNQKNLKNIYLDSSHFSDNNGHIICEFSIYRFLDINYAILNDLMPKNNKTYFISIFIQY